MAKVSKEERLLKIKALQDELKLLNEEEEPSEPKEEIKTEEPQQETVEDDDERGDCYSLPIEAIQKPKK